MATAKDSTHMMVWCNKLCACARRRMTRARVNYLKRKLAASVSTQARRSAWDDETTMAHEQVIILELGKTLLECIPFF